ncbi:DUF4230 domain-containing protein [Neolewinella lacunae]|uniref:DUF4230 domain-containing protein n=1 Tax=Neolewinella lacunae TaxID=1517758 RepID=A0A923PFS1_9BACT|nr:DUF4230 domain-containing protein [Neolewinella lacunae]MBC6993270.1 DUF4230 domain-containing protein [Neolewinella lacunae]MDN3635683.1 DUF4230 domain-containing protein [Neolewinella lacunae]
MADYQSAPLPPNRPQGLNRTQVVIILLIMAILGTLIFKYYRGTPGSFLAKPAEYELRYLPADFKANIDAETALAILQNPRRYRREFDQVVYDINTDILTHVSNRMGLNDSLQTEVIREYDRQHPQFAELYYNDFMRKRDTTAAIYETWYDEGGRKLTEIFEEVASNYTCFMVNKVIAAVIPTRNGNIIARGADVENPCKIATGEALRPLMARLAERAAIDDFSKSKGLFQEKVENVIGELATMEVRDKKGISKQLQTSIWGMNVSETDVEITAISILKVGFRLTDYFTVDLDEGTKTVRITLPEPTILSHEVLPKIEKLDIGWMRELEGVNINEGVNSLREAFRSDALASNIMSRAKTQASELMNTMFQPIVAGIGPGYKIVVDYQVPIERTTQGELQ